MVDEFMDKQEANIHPSKIMQKTNYGDWKRSSTHAALLLICIAEPKIGMGSNVPDLYYTSWMNSCTDHRIQDNKQSLTYCSVT